MKEIRDENYNYTELGMEIMDEFKEAIKPVLEKHKDSVSIPDLDFLVNMTSF
jgi:hypothetical protein